MNCPDCGCKAKRSGRTDDGRQKYRCATNAGCGKGFRTTPEPRKNLMDGPKCSVCGGPTSTNNKSGICTRSETCQKEYWALKGRSNPRHPEGKLREPKRYPKARHELFTDYDLDDGEEIVDDIAIGIAIEGRRLVRLTPTEQGVVAGKMIRMGFEAHTIADHLGVSDKSLDKIINPLGYERVDDPASTVKLITRKDRSRG